MLEFCFFGVVLRKALPVIRGSGNQGAGGQVIGHFGHFGRAGRVGRVGQVGQGGVFSHQSPVTSGARIHGGRR